MMELKCGGQGSKEKQKELFDALKKYDLQVGFLCGSGEKDYKTHLEAFKSRSMRLRRSS
jgi:hypothetical protein